MQALSSMHIGVSGPITLSMLAAHLPAGVELPQGYSFPLIAQYVNALLARGHRVTVFTLCPETRVTRFIQGDRLALSITPQRPRRWWLDLQQQEIRGLRDAMRAHPVDVMHAHWTYEFPRAALWAELPTLVTAHDSPWRILRMLLPTKGRWIRLSRQIHALRVLREVRALTAVSPYMVEELRRDFALSCPVTVVPNGLDEEIMVTAPRPAREPGNVPVLLAAFSGGFSGRKNGPVLLEACHHLQVQGRPFRLVLLGSGCGPGGEAEQLLRARGWALPIEFRGFLPHAEVLRVIREEADLFIHPSLEESFGMAVLEAMAQGVPVVGGAASGAVPWLLGHGEAGFLVDTTSPEALGRTITQVLDAPDRMAMKGSLALARARSEFSLGRMVETYEQLLRGLVPGKALP